MASVIKAEKILDSISPQGHRLLTMRLRYPRMIHAEFMTHRTFSRNASSSRATPVKKNLSEARDFTHRAAPIFWGSEQKGMQPGIELPQKERKECIKLWSSAALSAVNFAELLHSEGCHKSIVNRVIEPYLHINVLVSSTDYGYLNFLGLRLDKDADPIIRYLAEQMWKVYAHSIPNKLELGQWHLPFAEDILESEDSHATLDMCKEVSVARCARISYTSFETGKKSTIEEDLRLYQRLVGAQPLHASPAEHQATPDVWQNRSFSPSELTQAEEESAGNWAHRGLHGNFLGWIQFRKTLKGESVAPLPEGYTLTRV